MRLTTKVRRAAAATATVVAIVATMAGAAACGRVVAPPPPTGQPSASEVGMAGGPPVVVAARAARQLQDMGFTTRRFGSDSLWGRRAIEDMNARLRYVSPYRDSTRVLVELWGPCPANQRDCLRREARMILAALNTEEAPPQ